MLDFKSTRRATLSVLLTANCVLTLAPGARAQEAAAVDGPTAVANRNVSDCLNLAKETADANARGTAVHQCMRVWIAAVKNQPPPVVVSRAPNK
jgi:hypothetical protein